MLHPEISQALDDINTCIDYSGVEKQYRRGKKSLDERKEDHRIELLREEISDAIGEPGTTPSRRTIDFNALNKNINVFIEYLTNECRNEDGGIQKGTSYTGQRSSLTYLYRRYRETQPLAFQQELRESMEGVKRLSNEAHQHEKKKK